MDAKKIKLVAFDLDGTLTQHKTKLSAEHRAVLDRLAERYKLVMAGAGQCRRIFNQMDEYPIDIIGNYGMQYAKYNKETKDLDFIYDIRLECDKDACEKREARIHRVCR